MGVNKKQFQNKTIWRIVFFLIVVVQVLFITYCFADLKKGFHSDEPWTYGFANGYYTPYIYASGNFNPNEETVLRNFGEWKDGRVLFDYLTVGDAERFRFDSVYYGSQYDQSPPLYPILVHFVSSFFPNEMSWYFGYVINILAFVITSIFLQKFTLLIITQYKKQNGTNIEVTNCDFLLSVMPCVLYGFSYVGINTTVFVRMYALLTAFCTSYTYFAVRVQLDEGCEKKISYLAMGILVFLGSFTHYSFLIYACTITVLSILANGIKKNYKHAIVYGVSNLMGVALLLVVYPYALNSILGETSLQNSQRIVFPFSVNLDWLLMLFARDTLGMKWYIDRFFFLNCVVYGLAIMFIAALICFACRKEKWFVPIWKSRICPFLHRISDRKYVSNYFKKKTPWILCMCLIAVFVSIFVSAKISKVFEMGEYADRYVFLVAPVWDAIVCLGIFSLGYLLFKRKSWIGIGTCIVFIAVVLLFNQKQTESTYLFSNDNVEILSDLARDNDCVVVTNKAWAMEWYSAVLCDSNWFYAIDAANLENHLLQLYSDSGSKQTTLYMIVEKACFPEDGIDYAADAFSFSEAAISEKAFVDLLKDRCDWIEGVDYLYTQNGFRGELDIYKIEVK